MPDKAAQKQRGSRPSIRDVARKAGVSPGCVSNVINGRRKLDDPIGRAVLQAVRDLGYRRNTMASNLRRSQSRIIGLVIPNFENPFFAELVAKLEHRAEATNYRIVATSSREDADIEAREIDELVGWRVAGVFVIPSLYSRVAELVEANETPFVFLDRVQQDAANDGVGVNNADASAMLMRKLFETGHHRILVAYLGDGIDNVAERLEGVRAAVAGHNEKVAVDYLPTGDSVEGARAALGSYFDENPKPDAVFCLFNTATLAAYGLLQERGFVLGRDTALAGFDDSAWMAHVHPPVAAIVQPIEEIAKVAWERLLARIEGDRSPPETIRIDCRLETRGSLGPGQPQQR
ncbi:LacI family DNA-binding transcriptional regulator [uncultured Roseibium sp.]|uniref:LacI family DNA-binding transcriptional regulator n=1 Tax=uncultured Roseibium sp. TaxID=1936171 RepID=UPI0026304173|nr:LacI family DNA-binding transcriptional regulator [uncultured Roseibium sp.]